MNAKTLAQKPLKTCGHPARLPDLGNGRRHIRPRAKEEAIISRDLELSLGQTAKMTRWAFCLTFARAVFSFPVKLSSFALASKALIILHYSHLCTYFFKKT